MSAINELENLLRNLKGDGRKTMQDYVDTLTEGLGIILPDILNQIKALTERVKELEDAKNTVTVVSQWEQRDAPEMVTSTKNWIKPENKPKLPPTGPVRFGPVLNDGKTDPVHEAICKSPDNTFICQQCGHVHELPRLTPLKNKHTL